MRGGAEKWRRDGEAAGQGVSAVRRLRDDVSPTSFPLAGTPAGGNVLPHSGWVFLTPSLTCSGACFHGDSKPIQVDHKDNCDSVR